MNNRILNEVKRNRELMGINESELDEQGFLRGLRDGIKRGIEKGKDFVKDKVLKIKDEFENETDKEVESNNGKVSPEFAGVLDQSLDFEVYKDYTIFKEKSYQKELAKKMGIAGLEGLGFNFNEAISYFTNFEDAVITDFEGIEHKGYYAVFKIPNEDLKRVLNID